MPWHRSADHVLSITRNELNHLDARVPERKEVSVFANHRLPWHGTTNMSTAETPDWVIGRLRRAPIQRSFIQSDNSAVSASEPDLPREPEAKGEGARTHPALGKSPRGPCGFLGQTPIRANLLQWSRV